MSPTWREISDQANADDFYPVDSTTRRCCGGIGTHTRGCGVVAYPSSDGSHHVDWMADEHVIAEDGTRVSIQAGGWRRPDGGLVADVMIAANIADNMLSVDAARRLALALLAAAEDAERVRGDIDLVPVFSGSAR